METTTILIKTKKKTKKQAQELARELGLSLTDIINASLRQFIVNQGITLSRIPTESIDEYENKEEIIAAYKSAVKEFGLR